MESTSISSSIFAASHAREWRRRIHQMRPVGDLFNMRAMRVRPFLLRLSLAFFPPKRRMPLARSGAAGAEIKKALSHYFLEHIIINSGLGCMLNLLHIRLTFAGVPYLLLAAGPSWNGLAHKFSPRGVFPFVVFSIFSVSNLQITWDIYYV